MANIVPMQEKFIPGIYNYCDRWCERCTFTSRCRSYEGTSKLSTEQTDISNKAFWDTVAGNFSKAIELLHKMAAERGIDLNKPMTEEEEKAFEEKKDQVRKTVKQHELTKLCNQYQKLSLPFFKKHISKELVDKTKELVSQLHLGIQTEEGVVHAMANLGDCQDIIQWYLFFIDAKLQRALQGQLEGDDDHRFAKDSDGSAKIAIIAIERSIAAWARLYELLPSSEDIALKALAILSRLKRLSLETFPHAMDFKRPGFDEY